MAVAYQWRGAATGAEIEALHAEGFGHEPSGEPRWEAQLAEHSLGWVCARYDGRLVGFVNVAWDGSSHAFVLDTVVARSHQGDGVGTELVAVAVGKARAAGCEWVHVDFEEDLSLFYLGSCGFRPTSGGLLRLRGG
jgi:GNAT superfamily N-acetyltransferase